MRPDAPNAELTAQLVSIHAPVKDATFAESENAKRLAVSIHAPVKDATFVGSQ